MRLSQAIKLFLLSRVGTRPTTQKWYTNALACLETHLGDVPIQTITTACLHNYHRALNETITKWGAGSSRPAEHGSLSPATIHGRLRTCRTFFNWCHTEGHIPKNPAKKLKLPRLPDQPPKAISRKDFQKMLKAASTVRDTAIILFLADTACRVGGLCSVRLSDIDLDRHRVTVQEKGRRTRTVYLTKITATVLQHWLEIRPETDSNRCFTGQQGPLHESGVYQLLKRVARRAGVKRYNPHAFRHAWAREAILSGADLGLVASIMGHSNIKVTHDFYARWADDELARRHAQFSPVATQENQADDS